MAKETVGAMKYDPNTEAFQMRAQWHKAEICRKQWHERWSWLLEERKKALDEAQALRKSAAASLPHAPAKEESTKYLKPVPVTTSGFYGWLASKSDCQLEIYTPWRMKIPIKAPDAWELSGYEPASKNN